jgi:hypothetical protein
MNNRVDTHKKSSSHSAPMQNQLQSRPFPAQARQQQRTQTQQETAGQSHNLANISISSPVASPAIQKKAQPSQQQPSVPSSGSGKALPKAVQRKMESAFGTSLGDVRIHEGPEAKSIGAVAYTRGSNIHFQPGKYDPNSQSGQQLLGHELTHVVQQRAGQVATPQGKGAPINADPQLEAEADTMGAKAASGQPAQVSGTGTGIQRMVMPPLSLLSKLPKLGGAGGAGGAGGIGGALSGITSKLGSVMGRGGAGGAGGAGGGLSGLASKAGSIMGSGGMSNAVGLAGTVAGMGAMLPMAAGLAGGLMPGGDSETEAPMPEEEMEQY